MQQSDHMLLTSLRDFISIPSDIATLRDIRTDQIYQLSCAIFETLKIDYSGLKKISKAQRFRSMTKLTQTINQEMDTSIELNDVMNPTLPFIRKLILTFVSRLAPSEGVRQEVGGQENNEARYQKRVLKEWVQTEYICPELDPPKKIKYEPYRLKFEYNKNLFKRNIVSQLSNVQGNAASILRNTIAKEQMERKKREAEEGISKRKNEDADRNIMLITRNNQKDWMGGDKAAAKIRKNILEAQAQKKESRNNNESPQGKNEGVSSNEAKDKSVFQQEVDYFAEEQKKLAKHHEPEKVSVRSSQISTNQDLPEDPLERIKRECDLRRVELENHLQSILALLNEKKESIEEKERLKRKLEVQMAQYEEKATAEREMRQELKKGAEKQKLMLDSLEGETDIAGQVKQLEEEVRYLEKEAEKQIESMEKQIEEVKKEGERKLQVLGDLKIKLTSIENNYQNICEEIEDKKEIKSKVKINKSGINRIYYNKKINEMEVRWRETQRETNKIHQTVQEAKEEIRRSVLTSERIQTEIENATNTGKWRTETENLAFKDIFKKCQKTFQMTIKAVESINDTKNEIQEYEMKVHALAGKDYKENIKKLEMALEELKREVSQMKQ